MLMHNYAVVNYSLRLYQYHNYNLGNVLVIRDTRLHIQTEMTISDLVYSTVSRYVSR